MPSLFTGDCTDSDEEIKVNKDYANNYNNWRQKEELNKLKARYGDRIDDAEDHNEDFTDSSSTSSEEDSDKKGLNQQFEREFYRTLACLKKKDPSIYDNKITFFNKSEGPVDEAENAQKKCRNKKKVKDKAIFLRDYERNIILEQEGKFDDDQSDNQDVKEPNGKSDYSPTYMEKQRLIKESFKEALLDEDLENDTTLLVPKQKTENEKLQEEESYREWLKGQKLDLDPKEEEELKPLREFWIDPKLDSKEKFLRDYILNTKFLDEHTGNRDLDYNEIIHDSDGNLSEDEKQIQKQEEFEHKYNFRFEEPDKDFIKRYPRTMENSMRKKDTRRAQKRAEIKKRKDEEKLRKKEDLKHLKALKRKEIEEKIEKLQEITGNHDMCFGDMNLEGDFDPEEHDRKMAEIFNDEYYAIAAEENVKPTFPDIDEELDIENNWDSYDPTVDKISLNDNEPHCEDPDFNMDADYNEKKDLQLKLQAASSKTKRRRRSKFAELIAKEKPIFDPVKYRSYEEYFDQYYSLDFEDMIGDLPCRFKYRKVMPNDYGLTIEEILMADDKELNRWCSLKKAVQYKSEEAELNDIKAYKHKSENEKYKRKMLKSLYMPQQESETSTVIETSTDNKEKKRRRRKKKTLNNDTNITLNNNELKTKLTESKIDEEFNSCNEVNPKKDNTSTEAQNVNVNNKKRKKKLEDHPDNLKIKERKIDDDKHEHSQPSVTAEDQENNTNQTRVLESSTVTKEKKLNKSMTPKNSKNHNKSVKSFKYINGKVAKRKNVDRKMDQTLELNPERLKMYGISAKKLKNKLKYGHKSM